MNLNVKLEAAVFQPNRYPFDNLRLQQYVPGDFLPRRSSSLASTL